MVKLKRNPRVLIWLCVFIHNQNVVRSEIEHNAINEDGSFSYRHTNDDIGAYYHTVTGSSDNVVRGRYGSRNPATGQVEEVIYTAGPRGYRPNGPKIHRKTDLAQYPVPPIGSPDDPLADPYDTPAYNFKFRTPEQSKMEKNDETGVTRGLYTYIDDVGEKHSVRYAAGPAIGFQVSNAVPDTPALVGYTSPLYKAHPQTRGKTSIQRGPDGSYKLIASGPDHRRAESRGSDGLVRGTYSYLDDKGIQHTVEYIAGAGIGYRIVQNRVGPGTHLNPTVGDLRLSDNDFRLANDFGSGASGGLGGGRFGVRGDGEVGSGSSSESEDRIGSNKVNPAGIGGYLKIASSGTISSDDDDDDEDDDEDEEDVERHGNVNRNNAGAISGNTATTDKTKSKDNRLGTLAVNRGNGRFRETARDSDNFKSDADRDDIAGRGSKVGGLGGSKPSSDRNAIGADRSANRDRNRNRNRYSSSAIGPGSVVNVRGGTSSISKTRFDYGNSSGSLATSNDNYNLNDDDYGSLPPLITANRKILEMERRRDWIDRQRDSTIIQNVGKWYIGLPPGQSVRAHVQNIDLLPLGSRHIPSPAEALRQDEIADMVASLESGTDPMRSSTLNSS